MMELIPTASQSQEVAIRWELERLSHYVAAALAPGTLRVYGIGWRNFERWCVERGRDSLPATPDTVALYLSHYADEGLSPSTLNQRVGAIRWAHEIRELDSPTTHIKVRTVLSGIRRTKGVAPVKMTPLSPTQIAEMVGLIDTTGYKGCRDKLILLLGFGSALRRSEIAALDVRDITPVARGLAIMVRRSKTDQEGKGRLVAVPRSKNPELCTVVAYEAWVRMSGVSEGAVFLSLAGGRLRGRMEGRTVLETVRLYVEKLGLDPKEYGGHSLRSGFVTSASAAGASLTRIMDHTGHKSVEMVREYCRREDAFEDHAGEGLL